MNVDSERIAIVSLAGVFPGAVELDRYWQNIVAGASSVGEPPPGRWPLEPRTVLAARGAPDRVISTRGGFVDACALTVDLPGTTDATLDPQARLILHTGAAAWRGARTERVAPHRVGVIVGNIVLPTESATAHCEAVLGAVLDRLLPAALDGHRIAASAAGEPRATREDALAPGAWPTGNPAALLARGLGVTGPAMSLDAACASSLYALAYACNALREGELDAAIAGGLSRPDAFYTQMGFTQLRALSPSGHCTPFDARADGLVVGEGCGLFVLKRLDDARRDGDRIHGLIAGFGLSNDLAAHPMAPESEGQVRAMTAAYAAAGWEPESVDLVECHGTGTPVGDAVEFRSLCRLWSDAQPPVGAGCVIGSVKSNIGHLLTAAGSASLTKVLLALSHETLPPTAGFRSPAPGIDLDSSPFNVLSRPRPWMPRAHRGPRRAAVSGFGFGGVNAHLLVEEWRPDQARVTRLRPPTARMPAPAAILGIAARVGGGPTERAGLARLSGATFVEPGPAPPRWGLEGRPGHYLDEVAVPVDRFSIPPTEVAEMLPQQLLMLIAAADALEDAGIARPLDESYDPTRCGCYIGIALDPGTTHFHLRWTLEQRISRLRGAETFRRLEADGVGAARDAISPPLTANRTMGALGSLAASRIARALQLGGPCHTVSSEENSGIAALELALRALDRGDIDLAVVGAVDLAGDPRLGRSSDLPGAAPVGEGAVALVLGNPGESAHGERARVIGVLRALDDDTSPARRQQPLEADLLAAVGIDPGQVGLIEKVLRAGSPEVDEARIPERHESHTAARVGHCGAAAGLMAVAASALALEHQQLPASDAGAGPTPWLHDRSAGPRRALARVQAVDRTVAAVLLESGPAPDPGRTATPPIWPAELLLLSGPDRPTLRDQVRRLALALEASTDFAVFACAARANAREAPCGEWRAALLGASRSALREAAAELLGRLDGEDAEPVRAASGSGWWLAHTTTTERPTFVYPGSGNHFPGMGRDLACALPEIVRDMGRENLRLRSQFAGGRFWETPGVAIGPVAAILGPVWLGAFVTDALSRFQLRPRACVGYSLGETTALVSTRAWRDRDALLERLESSPLFREYLGPPWRAAREAWRVPDEDPFDWLTAVVDQPEERVRSALADQERAHVLIVNSPGQCVVGGERGAVEQLAQQHRWLLHPVPAATSVHCGVVAAHREAYRALHLLPTDAPEDVSYYRVDQARAYRPDRESAADAITAQALDTIDFPSLVERAYADGSRLFIEIGPGGSVSRMIGECLGRRPHTTVAICTAGGDERLGFLRALAAAHIAGNPVRLDALDRTAATLAAEPAGRPQVVLRCGGTFNLPRLHEAATVAEPIAARAPPATALGEARAAPLEARAEPGEARAAPREVRAAPGRVGAAVATTSRPATHGGLIGAQAAHAGAHEAYLDFAEHSTNMLTRIAALGALAAARADPAMASRAPDGAALAVAAHPQPDALMRVTPAVRPSEPPRALDRAACVEFAVGSIAAVLGPRYAAVDEHPTRVRLPDEPLMLVDRILDIEGDPCVLGPGRVITEHDVYSRRWYLNDGHIPTALAVESGQADLFLSAYLGIDHHTRGLAVYRLLDAEVTFHAALPRAGSTIRYDIRIDQFFRQDDTHLFRFGFDATVDGRPLLQMRNGCAGFFTPAQLDAGRGLAPIDAAPRAATAPGYRTDDVAFVPLEDGVFDAPALDALRRGDPAACFGEHFANLDLEHPLGLPGGRLGLVHRIVVLEPRGGPWGLGRVVGETDISADDWFLTCHFVDDQVMPGTLMYESCLQTLRVLALRLGWVGERDAVACEPVPGERSGLKCRGQVTASTGVVRYEVLVKALGFSEPEGTPYAHADAVMYADGRPVVRMVNMTLRLSGLTRDGLAALWSRRRPGAGVTPPTSAPSTSSPWPARLLPARFDAAHVLEFARGRPSLAFGAPYRAFDADRKIARLPGPPYAFIDRIDGLGSARPFELRSGAGVQAQFLPAPDHWYFEGRTDASMPYAVLLEVALQPCGWLAAYLGAALLDDTDLWFRNLGGKATPGRAVTAADGPLTTRATLTKVSRTPGMIIVEYDFALGCAAGDVLVGDTYFGFFTAGALANQVGIRDAKLVLPADDPTPGLEPYPSGPGYPGAMLRMLDTVTHLDLEGGPHRLGYARGSCDVDPAAWFFEAHFKDDPVWPGSLGLESLLQLLYRLGRERWPDADSVRESPLLGVQHEWVYRGQILPGMARVTVEAVVTAIDDGARRLVAGGTLSVDGVTIYEMRDFGVALR